MYDPARGQTSDFLDFEIGGIIDSVKKIGKGAAKAVGKVTDATITKPSMMIGKAIGGKKGEAIGKKLGGFTAKVTNLGVAAGAAGLAAGAAPAVLGTVAPAMAAKKLLGSSSSGKSSSSVAKAASNVVKTFAGDTKMAGAALTKSLAASGIAPAAALAASGMTLADARSNDNALAAKVGAMLVKQLGGPLSDANKALQLAELQRQATYEHKKLMGDAEFRKKVLTGIATVAAKGDAGCQRTIRVLVGR